MVVSLSISTCAAFKWLFSDVWCLDGMWVTATRMVWPRTPIMVLLAVKHSGYGSRGHRSNDRHSEETHLWSDLLTKSLRLFMKRKSKIGWKKLKEPKNMVTQKNCSSLLQCTSLVWFCFSICLSTTPTTKPALVLKLTCLILNLETQATNLLFFILTTFILYLFR